MHNTMATNHTSNGPAAVVPVADKQPGFATALKAFVVQNFLPLAFLVAIAFALIYPVPGKAVVGVKVLGNVHILQEMFVVFVFFISGLTLKTDDMMKALRFKLELAYGMVTILFLTGFLGFAMKALPLAPPEFSIGLTIYSVVPTTLGVGVALVRSCKGNEAIALLLTVASNMLGIVTMPLMLKMLLDNRSDVSVVINLLDLFIKLAITIVAPSVVGKVVRKVVPGAAAFTRDYKISLGIFSTTCLALIVWQTLSSARALLVQQAFVNILYVILLAIAQHLLYLAVNYAVCWKLFKLPLMEAIAVFVMSSQKSAPVAVTVISYITPDPAIQGLLAIPCVVGQISQIFVGSAFAPYFAKQVDAAKASKAAHDAAASLTVAALLPAAESVQAITVGDGSAADEGKGQGQGAGKQHDEGSSAAKSDIESPQEH